MEQRRLLLAVVLSLVILVSYNELVLKHYQKPRATPAPGAPAEHPAPTAPEKVDAAKSSSKLAAPSEGQDTVVVETDLVRATFTTVGARLKELHLKHFQRTVHSQGETDYTNDTFAVQITLAAPDLSVTKINSPASGGTVVVGGPATISWEVTNAGTWERPEAETAGAVRSSYDADGRRVRHTGPRDAVQDTTFDDAGRVQQVTYALLADGPYQVAWTYQQTTEPLYGLPEELDGLRIAHLSDFHLGVPSGGSRAVEAAVRWVEERRPLRSGPGRLLQDRGALQDRRRHLHAAGRIQPCRNWRRLVVWPRLPRQVDGQWRAL